LLESILSEKVIFSDSLDRLIVLSVDKYRGFDSKRTKNRMHQFYLIIAHEVYLSPLF
jgi:hypothetical protein